MADNQAARYSPAPDPILHNRQGLTGVPALGDDADVRATAGRATRRVDLGGRTVLPGFVDTHAHMDREGLRHAYSHLRACRSIADVQAVVRREAAGRPPGEWIVVGPLGEP